MKVFSKNQNTINLGFENPKLKKIKNVLLPLSCTSLLSLLSFPLAIFLRQTRPTNGSPQVSPARDDPLLANPMPIDSYTNPATRARDPGATSALPRQAQARPTHTQLGQV